MSEEQKKLTQEELENKIINSIRQISIITEDLYQEIKNTCEDYKELLSKIKSIAFILPSPKQEELDVMNFLIKKSLRKRSEEIESLSIKK